VCFSAALRSALLLERLNLGAHVHHLAEQPLERPARRRRRGQLRRLGDDAAGCRFGRCRALGAAFSPAAVAGSHAGERPGTGAAARSTINYRARLLRGASVLSNGGVVSSCCSSSGSISERICTIWPSSCSSAAREPAGAAAASSAGSVLMLSLLPPPVDWPLLRWVPRAGRCFLASGGGRVARGRTAS
jgi:hypothetical protein